MMPARAFAIGTRGRERRPVSTAAGAGRAAGGRAVGAILLAFAAVGVGPGADGGAQAAGDPFVQDLKGVTVDWRRGKLTAHGAAAGDWRTPSAEIARAGAERRARSAGRARLMEALRALPLGGGRHLEAAAVERAVGRARTAGVEYQSNGGVDLKLEISAVAMYNRAATAAPMAATTISITVTFDRSMYYD